MMSELHCEQLLRVAIAHRDPCLRRSRRSERRLLCHRACHPQHHAHTKPCNAAHPEPSCISPQRHTTETHTIRTPLLSLCTHAAKPTQRTLAPALVVRNEAKDR